LVGSRGGWLMAPAAYVWPDPPRWVSINGSDGFIQWEGEELHGFAPESSSLGNPPWERECGGNGRQRRRVEFFKLRGLIRPDEVARLLEGASLGLQRSLSRGGSMAPDSVDKFPTLWHYFIEHGRYLGELDELLRPIVEERVEPYARQRYGPDVLVCHSFVRRYLVEERRRLGAHFDHHAYITAVVGLNPEDFEGGLFVQGEARSNRVFVPLEKGDVFFHQYDLHHGVEVTSGSRYSLVFWLMDSRESCVRGTVPWYKSSAEAGDSDAQHLWASCLASGEHSGRARPDLASAIPWFEKAVAQKNVEAMNVYAAVLWEDTFARDDNRALALWREASDLGYAKARGNLGGILCTGMDGRAPKDYTAGIALLRSASEMDDYDAMIKLASHLRRAGHPEALQWLDRCAEMGNPDACIMLSEVHLSGELGISPDAAAIVRYTRWAANLGHEKAAVNLGSFYARGEHGLQPDVRKAVELWQKGAAKGDADAQINMALCYLNGEGGLPCDPHRALRLCESAASQGQMMALRLQLEFSQAAASATEMKAQATSGPVVQTNAPVPAVAELPIVPKISTGEADVAAINVGETVGAHGSIDVGRSVSGTTLSAGTRVCLMGLTSPEGAALNGRAGTVCDFDPSKGRWLVSLRLDRRAATSAPGEGDERQILVRPENLCASGETVGLPMSPSWERVD